MTYQGSGALYVSHANDASVTCKLHATQPAGGQAITSCRSIVLQQQTSLKARLY